MADPISDPNLDPLLRVAQAQADQARAMMARVNKAAIALMPFFDASTENVNEALEAMAIVAGNIFARANAEPDAWISHVRNYQQMAREALASGRSTASPLMV